MHKKCISHARKDNNQRIITVKNRTTAYPVLVFCHTSPDLQLKLKKNIHFILFLFYLLQILSCHALIYSIMKKSFLWSGISSIQITRIVCMTVCFHLIPKLYSLEWNLWLQGWMNFGWEMFQRRRRRILEYNNMKFQHIEQVFFLFVNFVCVCVRWVFMYISQIKESMLACLITWKIKSVG